jgi:antitoxin component HigA of HigAB toxin-antitoxin module
MVIQNELEYQYAFQQIEKLITEKFESDTAKEMQFIALTTAIEQYENDVLKLFPVRSTKDAVVFLTSLMSLKKLKNNDLARILHISENELSAIMHYQKPFTFEHAERVKKAFNIEATFIPQAA